MPRHLVMKSKTGVYCTIHHCIEQCTRFYYQLNVLRMLEIYVKKYPSGITSFMTVLYLSEIAHCISKHNIIRFNNTTNASLFS